MTTRDRDRAKQRTKLDAEVERQRVIDDYARSLVAVRVLTYPRSRYRKPDDDNESAAALGATT